MVEMKAVYEGGLRCRVKHGPSGSAFLTDAPKDNQGRGAAFSPTDLVGAALGSCMLTTIGIALTRRGIDISGACAHVTKEMVTGSERRIRRLAVTLDFPRSFEARERMLIERAAQMCPVHRSLHPDVDAPVRFRYAQDAPPAADPKEG